MIRGNYFTYIWNTFTSISYLSCLICHLSQCVCQLKLGLYLGSKLLHFSPALCILPPNQFDDCSREWKTDKDVEQAKHHIKGCFCHKIRYSISHLKLFKSYMWASNKAHFNLKILYLAVEIYIHTSNANEGNL